MAKKRTIVEEIIIDGSFEQEDKEKPKCLGEKEEYCTEEICGKYFTICRKTLIESLPEEKNADNF